MSLIIQTINLNAFELLSNKVKEFYEQTNLVDSISSTVEPQIDYSGVEDGLLNYKPSDVKIIEVGFKEASSLEEKNLIEQFILDIRLIEKELSMGGGSQKV